MREYAVTAALGSSRCEKSALTAEMLKMREMRSIAEIAAEKLTKATAR